MLSQRDFPHVCIFLQDFNWIGVWDALIGLLWPAIHVLLSKSSCNIVCYPWWDYLARQSFYVEHPFALKLATQNALGVDIFSVHVAYFYVLRLSIILTF